MQIRAYLILMLRVAIVQGKIENKGIMNINGATTFGNAVGNQVRAILTIKSPTIFDDYVENWDGNTGIGATILVESHTTFWRLFNHDNAKIIIQSPTTITTWLDNYNNATLEIRGATLTTTAGLWNYLDATLIFSALNGQLGKLIGDLINQNNQGKYKGKVKVIITGLVGGQKYKIIDGQITALEAKDIEFIGGNASYLGNGYVLIDEVFSVSTPIKVAYQANISTMNSMFLQSNAIMSSNKHNARFRKMANLRNPIYKRIMDSRDSTDSRNFKANNLDSIDSLNLVDSLDSNDSPLDSHIALNDRFYYRNDSLYLANARDKAQNAQSAQSANPNDKYYFLFTPFINHTYFYESGNYNISGLDGGFITAFSGKLDESNTLGTHFAFSYGSLGDKNDKDFI